MDLYSPFDTEGRPIPIRDERPTRGMGSMNFSALNETSGSGQGDGVAGGADLRAAPRFVSLIRAAKLVTPDGEFVCVVRDVSQTGIKVKTFHPLPPGRVQMALELQNGERFELRLVRAGEGEASFVFTHGVAIERLIREHWSHPRRQFRLSLRLPVRLHAGGAEWEAEIGNISQQGARLTADARFARDQMLRIVAPDFPETHAKVRWRRGDAYGVVFEETFSLSGIARLAAQIQCPELLRDGR